ncbi:MAG: hypothetical protein M3R72_06470 [Bacteroidota bacterium]|nr:hypothetical protein [Bacteroidota bacterium]
MAITKRKIFTRLTSNKNNWELPNCHRFKKENQGKKGIAFENQYGFGHEEWLMNPRYNVNGFQYGFIRGFQNSKHSISKYDEVHLYTVKKEKTRNLVYYLGFVKNVYSIKNNIAEQKKIATTISKFNADMVTEVRKIGADVNGINKSPFKAVVKFKLEDVALFGDPILNLSHKMGELCE